MGYLDRLKNHVSAECPPCELPKVPKAPYDSFDSSQGAYIQKSKGARPAPRGSADGTKKVPFDVEAFEERAGIVEFDGGLSRADAKSLAWREDDRRRCRQCKNLRQSVCTIAKPEDGALVVANRGYRPVNLPLRCEGFAPMASDPDQRKGVDRWFGFRETLQ